MEYKSTRGESRCSDVEAVLRGLAPDGGLYVPADMGSLRRFDAKGSMGLGQEALAERVIGALLPGMKNMGELVRLAYEGKFETQELTPLVPLGEDWLLELFHGPTSAFKDVALSMLPRLMTQARRQTGERGETVILTATSGDTGKAALEGFHDVPGTRIIVFYPAGGVSPIQRRQMTTQEGGNVCVCALRGDFDDCQSAVKNAFAAIEGGGLLKASGLALSSANSINIGRLAPQTVYYFRAYAELTRRGRVKFGEPVDFVVPTGNFGDILAGYLAKLMGLPVGKLVCASNANRVLTDFFDTGVYDRRRPLVKTASPSMDILVSSNLERLLYLCSGGDAALVRGCMDSLKRDGFYTLPPELMDSIRESFCAYCGGEAETAETIARVWRERRYLCDPHTAVALYAAEAYKKQRSSDAPLVVLSTASPYKFPAAVLSALGGCLDGDEFAQLRTLEDMTGVPIPGGLSALEGKAERHLDETEPAKALDYILKKLGVGA